MKIRNVVNFIFELGMLKKIKHTGFQLAGVTDPDSTAEHTLRAAQIGYVLAVMENANPEKTACMVMIHDNPEARVGDQHKVAARYYSVKEAEEKAFDEQIQLLGKNIGENWSKYFEEYKNRRTSEGIIAKDADWLEIAFQAKEYVDLGYSSAQNWIDNVEKALETKSAKLILQEMKKTKFTDWWKDLKKMTYKKLK